MLLKGRALSLVTDLARFFALAVCAIILASCQTDPQFLWQAKVTRPSSSSTEQKNNLQIPVEAKINGQSVHLVFDTGTAQTLVLFSTAADRLGLKYDAPSPSAGTVAMGKTAPVDVVIGQSKGTLTLKVLPLPRGLDPGFDGLIGWPAIRRGAFVFDSENLTVEVAQKLPASVRKWEMLPIHSDPKTWLTFETEPKAQQPNLVAIDTGASGGVDLAPAQWRAWRIEHPDAPVTLNCYYRLDIGFRVQEVAWAKKLSLGSLVLTDVPVEEGAVAPNYMASLGMYAVTRINWAVDIENSSIYFTPSNAAALPYLANRVGAVFFPRDPRHDDLVAHVLPGTPAYEAGIRDNDVLLDVGGLDVTHWRTDPSDLSLGKFWEQPVGAKIELTLKHGDAAYKTTVLLRNIIGPSVDGPKPIAAK